MSGYSDYSDYIVPLIILAVTVAGIIKKTDIFDAFIEGAAEGLKTTSAILPSLICLMTCIGTSFFGFPDECTPLIFIRPLSGSGALSVYDGIISENSPDSFIGRIASTMMGSTETTFYTVAVYFSAAKVKKTRYAIPAALIGDMAGWILSSIAVRLIMK